MTRTSALLALSCTVAACGHSTTSGGGGGGGGGGISRNEDGVPAVDMSGFQSDFVPLGPLSIDPGNPKTWEQPGTYGLGIYAEIVEADGKRYLGMARFCGGKRPDERADCLALQKKVRIERLVSRLELAAGQKVEPKVEKALPKPIKIEDKDSGTISWLTLCDEACVTKAAKIAGVSVTLDDIGKAINAKLKDEQDKKAMVKFHAEREAVFADTKPESWAGDGPWWIKYSSRLVPYIDGGIALIGVASVDPTESKGGPAMIKAARNRARAELAKAMFSVVTKRKSPGGRTLKTESDLDIYGSTVIAALQHGGQFWALALCDQQCLKDTFEKSGIELPLASLQPGPVE